MDNKTAVERLQELQKKCGYQSHSVLTEYINRMGYANIESMLKDMGVPADSLGKRSIEIKQIINELFTNVPSQYENPLLYSVLNDLFSDVSSQAEKLLDHEKYHFPKKLTYGTLDIGEFTAFVENGIEQEDYLIVVSSGLFGFANLLAKCIGMLIENKKNEKVFTYSLASKDIDQALAKRHEPILRFIDLIMGYVWTGNPHSAQQYNPVGAQLGAISSIIRKAFELFVVGHEYSHILLGHLSKKAVLNGERTQHIQFNNDQLNIIVQNWEDEIAADYLSSQLVLSSLHQEGFDFGTSFLGIDITLLTLSMLESLREQKKNKVLSYETHPPGELRRNLIKQLYIDLDSKVSETVKQISDSNEHIFDCLWKRFIFVLKEMEQLFKSIKLPSIYQISNYYFLRSLIYRIGDTMLSKYDEQNHN